MPTSRHSPIGSSGRERPARDADEGDEHDPDPTLVFNMRGKRGGSRGAPIELMVIKRRGVSHSDTSLRWVAVEIWTLNRIYLVDGALRCMRVIDRATNHEEQGHALLGATLTGGQRRSGRHLELSQPFPLPGMDAIFRHAAVKRGIHPFGETSQVERVILRLGLTVLDLDSVDDAFHELTARFFLSPR